MANQNTIAEQVSLLNRSDGVTETERYLTRLCKQSFLSLWSYPSVYRDQGHTGKGGDGKEVCDLLVIFEDHLILFSDKDCAFPDKGDLDLDWSRWYRKAVQKSSDQIWGAERWVKEHPDRLFLNRNCTQTLPINLPAPDKMVIHRILVAHSASERCKHELGGSGSLIIAPDIIGDQHCVKRADGGVPFAIGQIDPARGYVHVFDDTTLNIVLTTLDTISEFVAYLNKKERIITSGKLRFAAGEEELLAIYLANTNEQGEHDFTLPSGFDYHSIDYLSVGEGCWEQFKYDPKRKAQIAANQVSYFWDSLIEAYLHHIYAGTFYYNTPCSLAEQEPGFRLMAREPRTRRRFLVKALLELIFKTPSTHRATRTILPWKEGEPHYVFLVYPHLTNVSYEKYRDDRRQHLNECCVIAKCNFPDAKDIVGIATESGRKDVGSEDMLYFDARDWSLEQQVAAKQLREAFQKTGEIGNYKFYQSQEKEYPDLPDPLRKFQHRASTSAIKGRDRNAPCPCGSGKKSLLFTGSSRMKLSSAFLHI